MALPPKGDPQRPLALAVRSTRFLGILFTGLGMCGTVPMFLVGVRGIGRGGAGGGGGMPLASMGLAAISTIVMYFGPGALYLVCSIFIARRRTWAVITAMVLAGIQILFLLVGLGGLAIMYLSAAGARSSSAVYLLIPLALVVFIILALAQLEYHLSKCFEAIRRAPLDVQRGFEPLQPAPVMPVVPPPPGESHGHSIPR